MAGTKSKAMADQIMAADKVRLKSRIAAVSRVEMEGVEEAIKVHLGMPR